MQMAFRFINLHKETKNFRIKNFRTMKKIYFAPEVMAYEVVAERGYENSASFGLPGFGTEDPDTWA